MAPFFVGVTIEIYLLVTEIAAKRRFFGRNSVNLPCSKIAVIYQEKLEKMLSNLRIFALQWCASLLY